jgi:hypothetical protein
MASANLELVRSIFVGWERGDYSSVDWVHPDIEFVIAGRAKASGVDLALMEKRRGANLFHISDGKVTRLVLYWQAECALADLGLSE